MKLKRKTPCMECPFRKNSMKGWLGRWSLGAIWSVVHGDKGLSCHMQNDKKSMVQLSPDEYFKKAHVCVGSILHATKTCKRHIGELGKFQDELKGSPEQENILGFEFKEHHKDCPTTDAEFDNDLKEFLKG